MNLLSIRNITVGIGLCFCSTFVALGTTTNQWQLTTLRTFGNPERNGNDGVAGVILGSDGMLYGTCRGGGSGGGTVFRIRTDGDGYEQIHNFTNSSPWDGQVVSAGIFEASNGRLYGTTVYDGAYYGTIYSLNKDGTDFRIIHEFAGSPSDGGNPLAGLVEASDGMLYGTSRDGGTNFYGTIFRLNLDGSGFEVLHDFDFDEAVFPNVPLLEASDGGLYGVSYISGYDGFASPRIYKLNKSGSDFQLIHDFGPDTGMGLLRNFSGLIEGANGRLFGTAGSYFGTNGANIVFSVGKDGQDFRLLKDFGAIRPSSPLYKGAPGQLFGATQNGGNLNGGQLFTLSEDGTGFAVTKTFGRKNDIAGPLGVLSQDASGNVYGVCSGGRASPAGIFALRGRKAQLLWKFDATGGDVVSDNTPVALAADGLLYGNASRVNPEGDLRGFIFQISTNGEDFKSVWDGPVSRWSPGWITQDHTNDDLYVTGQIVARHFRSALFRCSPDGKKKLIRQFGTSMITDEPVDGDDGFLYGTMQDWGNWNGRGIGGVGGIGGAGAGVGAGIIYRVGKSDGNFQALHHFTGDEARLPFILLSADGIIYGTAIGETDSQLFSMKRDGSDFNVLQTFVKQNHYPPPTNAVATPQLMFESNGALYGLDEWGQYFRIGKDGLGLVVIRHLGFWWMRSNMILGRDGLVYGDDAEILGRSYVYRMQPDGSEFTVLYDGIFPGRMVLGPDGALYGTTSQGGAAGSGFVFRLAPQ